MQTKIRPQETQGSGLHVNSCAMCLIHRLLLLHEALLLLLRINTLLLEVLLHASAHCIGIPFPSCCFPSHNRHRLNRVKFHWKPCHPGLVC